MIQSETKPAQVDAVLWDFDGTLADSADKNIAITQKILARVAPRLCGENLPPPLQCKNRYHIANHHAGHWRDLYRDHFGMTETEIDAAGPLWESYQLEDDTDVTLFDGISDTVLGLTAFPQGICSANASRNIRNILRTHGLASAFQSIIGYENLPRHQQKPKPNGGLQCLREIFGEIHDRTILFVGDHVADVIFARGLAEQLSPSNQVIAVAVTYSGANPGNWSLQPDLIVDEPLQLRDWLMA